MLLSHCVRAVVSINFSAQGLCAHVDVSGENLGRHVGGIPVIGDVVYKKAFPKCIQKRCEHKYNIRIHNNKQMCLRCTSFFVLFSCMRIVF